MSEIEDIVTKIQTRDRIARSFIIALLFALVMIQTAVIIIEIKTNNAVQLAITELKSEEEERAKSSAEQLKAIRDSQAITQDQHRQQDEYLLCIIEALNAKKMADCPPPFILTQPTISQKPVSAIPKPTTPQTVTPPPAAKASPIINVPQPKGKAQRALEKLLKALGLDGVAQ